MINVELLTERDDINYILPECIQLAKSESASLPFQYMHMPLIWWETFHSAPDTLFSQSRGKNFLGVQSCLEKFFILLARNDEKLCGVVPLVQYTLKMPAGRDDLQILTLAGDYVLHPFQDFVIDHSSRKQVIAAMLEYIAALSKKECLVFWASYIPEESPNLIALREACDSLQEKNMHSLEAISSQRGGVWPWTISGISATLNKISAVCEKSGKYLEGFTELKAKIAECSPQSLLFPRTRTKFHKELQNSLFLMRQREDLSRLAVELESSLDNSPMLYPYIELPGEREEYLASLSYSTRRYFKRYMKKFYEAGGSFETVPPDEITAEDIEDYIRLHLLRWGDGSAAICGKAADYHRNISEAMARLGMFRLFFARYQNRRIAVHSCFDTGNRREGYTTGVDPEFEELRAGRLLYIQTIYDAIDNGIKRYELGAVGFDYKMSFVQSSAVAHNIFLFPVGYKLHLEKIFLGFECMEPIIG